MFIPELQLVLKSWEIREIRQWTAKKHIQNAYSCGIIFSHSLNNNYTYKIDIFLQWIEIQMFYVIE